MTIATEACSVVVLGTGSQTTFSYPFIIPDKSCADLYLIDTTGLVTLIAPALWALTNAGSASGGTFVYPVTGVPLVAGAALVLRRGVPFTQTSAFNNQTGYYPQAIEGALDKLVYQTQDLNDAVNRSLMFPVNEPADGRFVLPTATVRANKILVFGSDGSPTVAAIPGAGTSLTGNASLATVIAAGGSAARTLSERFGEVVNVRDFGAVGDGTTSDQVAVAVALGVAVLLNRPLYFPAGVYRLTARLFATGALRGLNGAGKNTTTLVWDSPNNAGFYLPFSAPNQFCYISAMCLRVAGRGGTALYLDYSALDLTYPGVNDRFTVENVQFDGTGGEHVNGWDFGVSAIAGAYGKIIDCSFLGYMYATGVAPRAPSTTAYRFSGVSATYNNGHPVVCQVIRSSAFHCIAGVVFDGCEGAYVRDCTLVEVTTGVSFTGSGITRPHLVVDGTHINCYTSGVSGVDIVDAIIVNNLIYRIASATGPVYGVDLYATAGIAGNGYCQIKHNAFCDTASGGSQLDAVRINGATAGQRTSDIIDGNVFRVARTAITLGSGTSSVRVGPGNVYGFVTTSINDAGAGSIIAAASLTASGFDRSLTGAEDKWGAADVTTDAAGNASISFPTAFPSAYLSGVVCFGDPSYAPGEVVVNHAACTNNAMAVSLRPNPGAVTVRLCYMARGK